MSSNTTDSPTAQRRAAAALYRFFKLRGPTSALDNNIESSELLPKYQDEKQPTVRYLAYGSNLSKETFLGRRGIKPISQQNVCVPKLKLTFDLPGIAYTEPCFANSGWRDEDSDIAMEKDRTLNPSPYHKDRWHKPLVGVLYELTPADFIHVIQTEGGGASYRDIVVDCYPLDIGATTVPLQPTGEPIKGHTLFAPAVPNPNPPHPPPAHILRDRYSRPDPGYAQPSARYLKLIHDGALEHDLPVEYRAYLDNIRPYTMTTQQQRMGQFIFASIWLPIVMLMFALSRRLSDKDGKLPPWAAKILGNVFVNAWRSYDQLFNPIFGDGERTQPRKEEAEEGTLAGNVGLPITEKGS